MTKTLDTLTSACKVVVILALLAACLLPRNTFPFLRDVLNIGGLLLSAAIIHRLYRSGALGRRNTTAETVAKADMDYVAGGLITAVILVRALVL